MRRWRLRRSLRVKRFLHTEQANLPMSSSDWSVSCWPCKVGWEDRKEGILTIGLMPREVLDAAEVLRTFCALESWSCGGGTMMMMVTWYRGFWLGGGAGGCACFCSCCRVRVAWRWRGGHIRGVARVGHVVAMINVTGSRVVHGPRESQSAASLPTNCKYEMQATWRF